MTDAPSAEIFMAHVGKAVSLSDGRRLTLVAVDRRDAMALRRAPLSACCCAAPRADRARRHASPRFGGRRKL